MFLIGKIPLSHSKLLEKIVMVQQNYLMSTTSYNISLNKRAPQNQYIC